MRAQARAPWAPLAISAYIRAEGLRLWAKGLPIQPRPAHPRHAGTDARGNADGARTAPHTEAHTASGAAPTMAGRASGRPGAADAGVRPPSPPRTARARISAPVVSALFRRAARHLAAQGTPIRIEPPGGSALGGTPEPPAGAAPVPRMILHDPASVARRVGAEGLIGFGEAYMAGDWDSTGLAAVLTALATRMTDLVPPRLQSLRRLYVRPRAAGERNTTANARWNVAAHYDLSNDFFAMFLDDTLTYSSAMFTEGDADAAQGDPARADTARASPAPRHDGHATGTVTVPMPADPPGWPELADAQRTKIDRLLDLAGVGSGTRLLEIGTGWG